MIVLVEHIQIIELDVVSVFQTLDVLEKVDFPILKVPGSRFQNLIGKLTAFVLVIGKFLGLLLQLSHQGFIALVHGNGNFGVLHLRDLGLYLE